MTFREAQEQREYVEIFYDNAIAMNGKGIEHVKMIEQDVDWKECEKTIFDRMEKAGVVDSRLNMELYFEPVGRGYNVRATGRFSEQDKITDVEEYQDKILKINDYLNDEYNFNFINVNEKKESKMENKIVKKATGEGKVDYIKSSFNVDDEKASKIVEILNYKEMDPEDRLDQINMVVNGFGVEGITDQTDISSGISYINMGDTYSPTIIYDSGREVWSFGSWGDYFEKFPERFDENYEMPDGEMAEQEMIEQTVGMDTREYSLDWNKDILKKADLKTYTQWNVPEYIEGGSFVGLEDHVDINKIESQIKQQIMKQYNVPESEIYLALGDLHYDLDIYIGDDVWTGDANEEQWNATHVFMDETKVIGTFNPNLKIASSIGSNFEHEFWRNVAAGKNQDTIWFIYEDPNSGKKYIAKKNKKNKMKEGY